MICEIKFHSARHDATRVASTLFHFDRADNRVDGLATQLRVRGLDRSHAYNWRDSAEKTWQLHADL